MKTAMGKDSFETLDIYLAAYLALNNITPTLDNRNGKVIFVFPAEDSLYRCITQYNSNDEVPVSDFITWVKRLRGQMLDLRGPRR